MFGFDAATLAIISGALIIGGVVKGVASFGLPIVAIPSKRIPDALDLITDHYLRLREKDERYTQFVSRIGKTEIRKVLEALTKDKPTHEDDPGFYSDWFDPREYSTGDIGRGECAGEVVTQYQFAMTAAERMVFDAQVLLDGADVEAAGKEAFASMLMAAKALVQIEYDDVTDDPDEVVDEFRERFYDTKRIFDPFAGGKFATYLFTAHDKAGASYTAESARHTIEEAQLFIEAIHSCYNRMRKGGLSQATESA